MTATQSYDDVPLVTKREAADELKVSTRTIDRYISDGTLSAIRLSPRATRVTRASIDRLVNPGAALQRSDQS